MVRPSRRTPRHGASAVEFAFVAIIYLMVIFGILEFGRYLFCLQLTNNAAREGARFAVTNTNNFSGSTSANLQSVQTYVNNKYLIGWGPQMLTDWHAPSGNNATDSIKVYAADPASGYPSGASPPPAAAPSPTSASTYTATNTWTSASFGTPIACQIYGTYKPITPLILLMPSSITVNSKAIMYSEAN